MIVEKVKYSLNVRILLILLVGFIISPNTSIQGRDKLDGLQILYLMEGCQVKIFKNTNKLYLKKLIINEANIFIPLSKGYYILHIEHPYFKTIKKNITINKGEIIKISLNKSEWKRKIGFIVFDVIKPNSKVFIDGNEIINPKANVKYARKIGKHSYKIKNDRYCEIGGSVIIEPNIEIHLAPENDWSLYTVNIKTNGFDDIVYFDGDSYKFNRGQLELQINKIKEIYTIVLKRKGKSDPINDFICFGLPLGEHGSIVREDGFILDAGDKTVTLENGIDNVSTAFLFDEIGRNIKSFKSSLRNASLKKGTYQLKSGKTNRHFEIPYASYIYFGDPNIQKRAEDLLEQKPLVAFHIYKLYSNREGMQIAWFKYCEKQTNEITSKFAKDKNRIMEMLSYWNRVSFSPDLITKANKNKTKLYNLIKKDLDENFIEKLPPILAIQSIILSKNILNAEDTVGLSIELKNAGPGNAEDVEVQLSSLNTGLNYPTKTKIPIIEKGGGIKIISLQISGSPDLPDGKAQIDIRVIEPHFKVKIIGKRLNFATRKLKTPELILAKYAVVENLSAHPNNQVDINEMVDLKFAVQNIGIGDAETIAIKVDNEQKGVMHLGVVDDQKIVHQHPRFAQIGTGKYEPVIYRYFINSEFTDEKLHFTIKANEKRNKYGFKEKISVAINKTLKEEGFIRHIEIEKEAPEQDVVIEDIPEYVVDIETDLPPSEMKNKDGIAVVIGNQDYRNTDNVEYAINDANSIKKYLIRVFGYKKGNIYFISNAAKGDFELFFGTKNNHKGRLFNSVKQHKSDVFIYYSGHGAPGLKDRKGYFFPVEADPNYIELTGYPADVFYENLSKIPARSITAIIDACFSGENVHHEFSGSIEIEKRFLEKPSSIVLSSSKSNQMSSWYPEKQHGMFTYFFLKAIHNKNGDSNKDDRLTFSEMYQYISDKTEGIPYYARWIHGIEQVPTIEGKYENKTLVIYNH
jgi:Caspase domain